MFENERIECPKALKTPITIKPLLKKILPQMLFKIQRRQFSRRRMFVFFSYSLFCRSKEAKRRTVRSSRVLHFHRRAMEVLTKMTKTQTAKSITTKKAGLLLSTDSVNTLKTANSWLDSVVW